MEQNRLFHQTRLRLAVWYAGVMGCILGVCSFGVYQIATRTYAATIDRGLEAVAGALVQRIEPTLSDPDRLRQVADYLSFQLCLKQSDCSPNTTVTPPPVVEEVTNPVDYYIRLLDPNGNPIMIAGVQSNELPVTSGDTQWETVKDRWGTRYRQVSSPLRQQDGLWGYVQVGRSLEDLDQNSASLRWTLLLGCPVALLLVAWSGWWLAGLAMRPVYRSYQQIKQFTADAAHEFRTPLAAMQATIESALRLQHQLDHSSLTRRNQGDALPVLQRQTTRLSQLVKDLLLLARIEQQDIVRQYQPCCLNDLISDLMEELAFLAIQAEVSLSMQPQVQHPIYVLGDEEQLYRLVCNLINNAIQATPAGGQVTVLLDQRDHDAVIEVQDTGDGIPPDAQARIFDRFYRVDQDRSRHRGGSGLGLPIALAIAHAHQGSIHVQSSVGRGSTFTVRLPRH